MALPELPYNFHDAGITSIQVGPRHEVTIALGLDDPAYPPHESVYIRFGGITNFVEVTTFVSQVSPAKLPEAYCARIDALDYDAEEQSRVNDLVFRLALDMVGEVRIRCRSITTGPTKSPGSQADAFA